MQGGQERAGEEGKRGRAFGCERKLVGRFETSLGQETGRQEQVEDTMNVGAENDKKLYGEDIFITSSQLL